MQKNGNSDRERIIRKAELQARVGLSDATIWRMERDGRFPKRVRLGGNSCGWLESEINAFLRKLADNREMGANYGE